MLKAYLSLWRQATKRTLNQNETGAVNALLFPLLAAVILLLGAAVFGFWAFGSRQDYKNNTDQKIQVAVDSTVKSEDAKQAALFAEASKSPVKTYTGPAAYGSVQLSYPKTYSAYIIENSSTDTAAVDGYFYPNFVPDTGDTSNTYALRIQILNQSYATTLQGFQTDSNSSSDSTPPTITPYSLPKLKNVVGSEVTGAITDTATGTMVVLPLRDKTIEVWTEGSQFQNDFNTYVLPNLTFSP